MQLNPFLRRNASVTHRLSPAAIWSLLSVFVTNIGNGVYTLTVGKILFDLTGTPSAFGVVVILEYAINFSLQLFAGSIVDRGNPKWVCVSCDLLRGICIVLVSLLAESHSFFVGLILTTVVINAAKPFYRSATFAFVPAITTEETSTKYYAFLGTCLQVGQLLGVGLAGIAIANIGNEFAFATNGISYLLAGIFIWIAKIPPIAKKTTGRAFSFAGFLEDWKEIMQVFRGNKALIVMLLLCTGDYVAISFLNLAYVPLVNTRSGGNTYWLSVFDGSFAVGAIIASSLLTWLAQKIGKRLLVFTGILTQGLLFALIAYSPNLMMISALFLLLGVFNTFSVTTFMAAIQKLSVGTIKGRVASVRHISLTLIAACLIPIVTYSYTLSLLPGLLMSGTICMMYGIAIILCRRFLVVE